LKNPNFKKISSPEPLYQGVVMDFNDKKISIAFDYEIEPDKLPRNFAIIQLCNQVTYERINEALDTLHILYLNN
jgi:hypothetical protein